MSWIPSPTCPPCWNGCLETAGGTIRRSPATCLRQNTIRTRKKAASLKFRGEYGHTPLSAEEDIPWGCRRLVIGTGADGALPVMQQVRDEARRRKVDLVVLPTAQAIGLLAQAKAHTNAILHLTWGR
jgi:hypothetical protein